METKNIRIGDILIGAGFIKEEQLQEALAYQKVDKSKRLGAILVDYGYVTESQLLEALSKRLNVLVLDLKDTVIDLEAAGKIPQNIAFKYTLIPIGEEKNHLVVAMNDPLDFYAIEDLRLITNMNIDVVLAPREVILETIRKSYTEIEARKAASAANKTVEGSSLSFVEDILTNEGDAPIVNLVNSVLLKGHNAGASDIHIEPFEKETIIRLRVDGLIVDYLTLANNLHQSLIARIKILSNLDIAERRVPQDGHFRIRIDGVEMNVRSSSMPTVYGEKMVMRFLSMNVPLDHAGQFGMNDQDYQKILQMLQSPHGVVYITGPTGSGKTTTLYMILEMLSQRNVNIATIEDPVERNLPKINQTQVNILAGLTFDVGLRSILRQDPDIIMVGETRDAETASIAVRSAITGHLVLSTLHTNDAVSAVVRLQDMGVEPYMVANSLTGVVAQRLVKKICPNCREAYVASEIEKDLLGEPRLTTLYRGRGCHICNNTGYKGRTAIHEILAIDKTIRTMISRKEPIEDIYSYVEETGRLIPLRKSVSNLTIQGITSMEEFLKLSYYVE
ncbi:GspE/PulE family protein [Acetobacterium sp.]|jgi:type IV pilus assembly protein PilB|uniref:GspE/PulE family protein n=1 Tax=Acetobacterium sp. TaxID=1872094 RepID=UPI000CAF6A07|nr:GspE/PulE family protein [Acetobacterium sp.]MDO9492793.1 ATPase, T2SS/T4P/T4SS family [Acetobacterium sp.]PKM74279.1 MAG: type II secretion system protein GspE [Firmicutes bacterium HGW-Firmicutes-17]